MNVQRTNIGLNLAELSSNSDDSSWRAGFAPDLLAIITVEILSAWAVMLHSAHNIIVYHYQYTLY